MSVEQAKAFIERMKTDEAFREKVMAIEDKEARIACIQAEGFECTEEEINSVGSAECGQACVGAVHCIAIDCCICYTHGSYGGGSGGEGS